MNYEMGGTILSKTVKEKDLALESILFHRGPSMYGITYQLIVYRLVVLICSITK